jgi:lipoprotein Spr
MKIPSTRLTGSFLVFIILLASCRSHKTVSHSSDINRKSKGNYSALQTKYAGILGIDASSVNNTRLYSFIDDWTGTPYKYGGKNKSGIDCSGFTETLYSNVYEKTLTGSSRDLFEKCAVISKDNLQEGDLIFFKIESDKISHVGVYLSNGKFVHATVKKGVMISDLKEAYYVKYYYKGGRIK